MLPLFLATCAIVVGLGMVVPLLPFYAGRFGASAVEVTWLFAIYSACNFLAAPVWGRLSDRIGRKPVILICFAGTAVSYVWLAYVSGLGELFASRALAGAMGGWMAAGQGWVADSTGPDRRARGMGMLGAAFGIGFVIGPFLGALAVGGKVPNFELPILASAGASVLALAIGAVLIREPARHTVREEDRTAALRVFSMPLLLMLMAVYFAGFFVFSGLESTFALWGEAVLDLGPREVGLLLGFAGICMAIVQGGLLGRLAHRFGEARLVLAGIVALMAGLLAIPPAVNGWWLMPAFALLALGQGITNPSLQSLVSRIAPSDWKGGALGAAQAAASMGRILGPVWAGLAFTAIGVDWPFLGGALMLLPVFVLAVYAGRRMRRHAAAEQARAPTTSAPPGEAP
jgi:DHA1 family tetracycline resistance protein-like MFS transporter